MTQTFTLDFDFTAKNTGAEARKEFPEQAEPSENTLKNILNFSRNLEVKRSTLLETVDWMKS